MTEFRAILMVFAVMSVVTIGACFVLAVVHAPGAIYAVVTVLIISVGADTCSRIGMHYDSKSRSH